MNAQTKLLLRQCFCEFLGTALLCFMGPGCVSAVFAPGGTNSVEAYALSFGLTIYVVASSIGDISGCHINPAVSFAMMISGNIKPIPGLLYVVSQFVGGIFGAGLLRALTGKHLYNGGLGIRESYMPEASPFFYELIGTFFLIFVIFNVALFSAKPQSMKEGVMNAMAPLPIGFTVAICHLVLGPMTGCGINPARALGTSVWAGESFWDGYTGKRFWVYMTGPFVGAALGIVPYYIMYGSLKPGSGPQQIVPTGA